ncbi:MAG: cyclic nucleotide-binding domain-containing protein [Leptospirales bacterium]|nr:cyclic nucleotide-binding domain-containing protein [Leptospirales bacterium]
MSLDPTKPLQQAKIPAGSPVLRAGSQMQSLVLVHQGEVAAINRLDRTGKRRLYTLGANSFPGFAQLLNGQPLPCHYVASKDCVVSSFPARGAYQSLILSKLNVGVMAARSLLQEAMQSQQAVRGLSAYLAQLLKISDNLSLAYYRCNPQPFDPGQTQGGEVIDATVTQARITVSDFLQNGGQFPQAINLIWLQSDNSGLLKKSYEFDSEFDMDEFNFVRRLLGLAPNIQGAMFQADIKILEGLSRKLATMTQASIQELYQLHDSVDLGLESLLEGDYAFVEKFFLLSDLLDSGWNNVSLPEFTAICRFLVSSADTLLRGYQQNFGIVFEGTSPSLEKLRAFLDQHQDELTASQEKPVTEIKAGVDMQAVKSELAGSVGKIMSFLKIGADDQKNLIAQLKAFKKQQNPMDSGGDARKIRRQISQSYWKVYEAGYYKFRESHGNVPMPVKLMLNYGFFDEELLDDDHLAYIFSAEDNSAARHRIYNSLDWLDRVSRAEEPPSVDEMGLTYFEKMKTEFKDRGWKKDSDMTADVNTAERRVHYEIQSFLEVNVRLTTGSPTTAFPLLTRYQVTMALDKAQVTYERLSQEIDNLLAVDFSAFHREVLLNDESRDILKEFIQTQVIPNFIIVPSIGTKVMMWQDVSGRSKSSPGRIAVPVFATADLFTLLMEAVAAFRWELTKTIMGPDWNNVSQPSITADYTDYVQFYKKNRELSPELKEKLAVEFKRFRSDRDRFVNDYINWIKFESQGVMKLNKVVRAILYRHIPFAKSIRDNVANQPAFSDIHNRFKNIRTRKLRELEVRYRKFGESMPKELQENLDFYKV